MKFSYKEHKEILLFLLLPIIILVVRFDDIRGSFFLNTIEFIETDGQINKSDISHGSKPRFKFDIIYQYKVNGKSYESNRIGFGFKGSDKKQNVDLIINRYPIGKRVAVYFDKSNPSFSVLEPERNSKFGFIFLSVLYLMGVGLVIYALVKSRYNKPFKQDK
ncbi:MULTISPECIES: DUF3592 domain-containing protein [unclassified Colwellia]|uniref:DUF3592 domain-containing protein n=1 Tax=unclassified Colwellia TaxID=196834 RepID=UPI0015F5F262|nr:MULTISPECIES: DUF3592 domain-containing protein [unclassified Colwellia]MBA6256017.1 DUF3592 domain-containing protein [Colwellia sp. MB3u-28]MBA6260010.1 DUF3592 domain-containing protein [Colwellia sp. MB3u-41]